MKTDIWMPRFLKRSIALRLTFFLLLLISGLLLVGGIWQIQHVKKAIAEELHLQANKAMDMAISVVDSRVAKVETAVATAAAYAEPYAHDAQKAYELLYGLIKANDDIAAATLLYRADYFKAAGRYYAPTVYREGDSWSGEESTLEQDEIGGPENDFAYLETDSNWIYTCKQDGPYWCLPYVDSMSTKRPMVTFSVPLHEPNGDIYAVLCADVDLRWVQRIVDDAKPYDFSQVSVLSRDARYICHPDSNNILSENALSIARSENDEEFLLVAQRMLKGERGIDTVVKTLNVSGKKEEKMPSIIYFAPVKRVQWAVGYSFPIDRIMERPNRLRVAMFVFLFITLLLVALITYGVVYQLIRPFKTIALSTKEVAKGNFHAQLPDIHTHDELRQFRDSFEEMQRSLESYVKELQETTASKASIENELKVAANIQMGMLPKIIPPFPDRKDIDLCARLKPAKEVGGDLFDYHIRDGKLFFCIGDVSGKGVPAALFMAMARSLFRNISATSDSPADVIRKLNDTLSDGNDFNMFCTFLLGVLDLKSGQLDYCNAGHNEPVLMRHDGSDWTVRYVPVKVNIALGLFEGFEYSEEHARLVPGDKIFLYTDGVTEAENVAKELYGEERLLNELSGDGCPQTSPAAIVDKVFTSVLRHEEGAVQSDDITVLVVEYCGNDGAE